MNLRSTIEDNYNKVHYLLTCPHCGEEVIVDSKELFDNRVLFEPKEIEYEFWSGGFGSIIVIKCNHCGEVEDITNYDNW